MVIKICENIVRYQSLCIFLHLKSGACKLMVDWITGMTLLIVDTHNYYNYRPFHNQRMKWMQLIFITFS